MALFLIGETFGIEIESDKIFSDTIAGKITNEFKVVNDASVETANIFNLNGTPCFFDATNVEMDLPFLNKKTLGVEIVSRDEFPLILNEGSLDIINKLVFDFMSCGDRGVSKRAGVHFHITLPPSLRILKEIINLGVHLEDLFFWIAGMGYEFRGDLNDSTYCRPITKFGPQCVKTPRGYSQVFNTKDLLEAETIRDFKEMYGDLPIQMGNRYVPVRYSWLNLYSMFTNGSLEFRPFNLTSNGNWIYAVARLCGFFVKKVLTRSFSGEPFKILPENSVFDYRNNKEIVCTFLEFFSDIPKDLKEIILLILENTPRTQFKKKFVYSHLQFHANGNKTKVHFKDNYRPRVIPEEDILIPFFEDIHNKQEGKKVVVINHNPAEWENFNYESSIKKKGKNLKDILNADVFNLFNDDVGEFFDDEDENNNDDENNDDEPNDE